MERPPRSKGASMMRYLSKAATFSVSHPPHSPGKRSDRGFSGPIVSIIPKEVQHKKRTDSGRGGEPSSPEISCMCQVKSKKKKQLSNERKKKMKKPRRLFNSCFTGLLLRRVRPGGEPSEKEAEEKKTKKQSSAVASAPVPRLGQMRRYQSGRETLAGFDWRKAMEEEAGAENKNEEEDDVFIPHSAPILVGGGAVALEPKKEVNLWKRRDMPPPIPLHIVRN